MFLEEEQQNIHSSMSSSSKNIKKELAKSVTITRVRNGYVAHPLQDNREMKIYKNIDDFAKDIKIHFKELEERTKIDKLKE